MNKNRISACLGLLGFALATTGCVSTTSVDDNAAEIEASRYNTQAAAEYLRQGSLDTALEKVRKAIEQNDNNADAHLLHGMILVRQNDPDQLDEAEEAYEEAVSLQPQDPIIRNNYGSFLCNQGEYNDAIRQFLRTAENHRYQQPEAAWTNAGMCAMRIPDFERAEKYLRKALDINREHVPALWQMAQLMLKIDRPLLGRAFLQRLEVMGALPPEALWLGVQIERKLGDRAAAKRYADILLRDFPESREAALVVGGQEAAAND